MQLPPRGIRNRNPLNIRIGNDWLGEVKEPFDPEFEQFTSMVYGLRAGFVVLRRYILRYRRDTVRKVISSWAPSCENETARYVLHVSRLMGLQPDDTLEWFNEVTMVKLVDAMCYIECGVHVSRSEIVTAYRMVRDG